MPWDLLCKKILKMAFNCNKDPPDLMIGGLYDSH